MSLLSRVRFEIVGSGIGERAGKEFLAWLASLGHNVQLQVPGLVEEEGRRFSAAVGSDEGVSVRQYALVEESGDSRFTTTLTVYESLGVADCWIDQEWSNPDPLAAPPRPQPPILARRLIETCDCRVGAHTLGVEPHVVDSATSSTFLEMLFDPSRSLPMIVASQDRYGTMESTLDRARVLQQQLAGSANVIVLTSDASDALDGALPQHLVVSGGALRLFLPGADDDGDVSRHLLIPGAVYTRDPDAVARRFLRPLSQMALVHLLPSVYRERIAYMDGFPRSRGSADATALLAELLEVEAERERVNAELEDARLEVEFSALQLDESERLLDAALARARFLEARLRAAGDYASATEATPASMLPESAETCIEAVGLAQQYLDLVDMGSTESAAGSLDTWPKSPAWAKKAWRVFRAMQDYADLKETDGFDGDFLAYCAASPTGRTSIPPSWVAMKESGSTDTNPRFRNARTFPVPEEVRVEGEVYMPAHVKLEAGGRPAPRIHFHDDTSGPTASVHVGYFGEHLPSSQTN
jgi:hypothetical protein